MVREILIWPDPGLKKKAVAVPQVDPSVRELVDDLFETMYAADGVGLAAPQIGVLKRVVVIDTSPKEPGAKPLALINPSIEAAEGVTLYTEGCLSVPGEAEEVERAERVTVRFMDLEGKEQRVEAQGLLAIALQHETDHLDGVVFVDHVSSLKRELIRKRMKRLKAEQARAGANP